MSGSATTQGGTSVWVRAAQAAWVVLVLIMLAIFIAGLGPRFNDLATVCEQEPCLLLTLNSIEVDALQAAGFTLQDYAFFHAVVEIVVAFVTLAVAVFILWRKSDDRMGLLFAFALAIFALNFIVEADAALYRMYPALGVMSHVGNVGGAIFIGIFYLFPTGHFVPGWTRWALAVLLLGALIDPFLVGLAPGTTSAEYTQFLLLAQMLCLAIGVYAQIYRYRHVSNAVERQQTKWILFGLFAVAFGLLTWAVFVEVFPLETGPRLIFNTWIYAALAVLLIAFPVAVLISILRYRLWDIDVIIRRTLTYALVTVLLLIVFFGCVVMLQRLFAGLTGSGQNEIVTVLSTLAIAALFVPLRSWIQNAIDRRFNRKRYDAQQVLNDFATTVRDETDLEHLTARLMQVVDETMQPKSVSVWLRGDSRPQTTEDRWQR